MKDENEFQEETFVLKRRLSEEKKLINNLRVELERERDAVDFYANTANWDEIWVDGNSGSDEDEGGYVSCSINLYDVELDENKFMTFGGRTARETQKLRTINL